jgi:hypothetical protein
MLLSQNSKTLRLITPTAGAAGITTINSSVVDMQGFRNLLMIVAVGAITAGAVTSIKAQQGDSADLSDAADLEGTGQVIAVGDAEKIFAIEIVKPTKRYLKLVVSRATANAVIATAIAVLTDPISSGSSQGTGVAIEAFASPAAGVA